MEHSIIDFLLHYDTTHQAVKYSDEYKSILDERMKIHNKLIEMLTKEQREQFNKYIDSELGEFALSNDAYFKLGMKMGIRLAAECMFDL